MLESHPWSLSPPPHDRPGQQSLCSRPGPACRCCTSSPALKSTPPSTWTVQVEILRRAKWKQMEIWTFNLFLLTMVYSPLELLKIWKECRWSLCTWERISWSILINQSQTNSKSTSQFVCAFLKNVFTRRSCNCQCDGPHCLMGEKLNSFTVKIFLRIVKIRRRFKWSWLGTQWYLTACPNKDGPEAASSLGHLFFNNRDKDMETKKISWHRWWVVMVMTWLCGKIDSNIIVAKQCRWHL